MTDQELIDQANRAYHDANMELWKVCMWLLRTRGYDTKDIEQDQVRCALRETQKDRDEYVEEMSLGGRTYNSGR